MTNATTAVSRADRAALISTILIGIAGAVGVIVLLVQRIIEVIPNRDVPVLVPFVGTASTLPLGPDGASVPVDIDRATVLVSDMAGISLMSLILAAIIPALAALVVIACVCLFCRNLIAGRAFGKQNSGLVTAAAIAVAAGWAIGTLFTTMGVNGAMAALGQHSYENATASIDLVPLFAVVALGAVAMAFQVGARLQRDTDGLV